MRRLLGAVCLALATLTASAAGEDQSAALLRLLAPDLRLSQGAYRGHLSGAIKPMPGFEGAEALEEGRELTVESTLVRPAAGGYLACWTLNSAGGFQPTVVALFQAKPEPKLVDAVTVAGDVHASLSALELGPGRPAMVVHFWHDNSSESYDYSVVAGAVGGRIKTLLTLPLAHGAKRYLAPDVSKTTIGYKLSVANTSRAGYRDLLVAGERHTVCQGMSEWQRWRTVTAWNPATQSYDPIEGVPKQATGVVTYRSEEELRLDTGRGRLGLTTQEPSAGAGGSPRVGDICRVRYQAVGLDLKVLELKREGRDEAVTRALEVVQRHYQDLAEGRPEAAYHHLSRAWRARQSRADFIEGNSSVSYRAPRQWVHGVKVLDHEGSRVRLLVVAADLDGQGPGSLRFSLARQGQSWVIERVEALPITDWLKA